MHFVYILYSKKINKYYIGESENPEARLKLHNEHYFKKGFTKASDDWEIVLQLKTNTKSDALYLEKFIKRMKSKKFIQKVIANNNILNDILSKK